VGPQNSWPPKPLGWLHIKTLTHTSSECGKPSRPKSSWQFIATILSAITVKDYQTLLTALASLWNWSEMMHTNNYDTDYLTSDGIRTRAHAVTVQTSGTVCCMHCGHYHYITTWLSEGKGKYHSCGYITCSVSVNATTAGVTRSPESFATTSALSSYATKQTKTTVQTVSYNYFK